MADKMLVIEFPLSKNDITEADAEMFLAEAKLATGFSVDVGRPADDNEQASRTFSVGGEYFSVSLR